MTGRTTCLTTTECPLSDEEEAMMGNLANLFLHDKRFQDEENGTLIAMPNVNVSRPPSPSRPAPKKQPPGILKGGDIVAQMPGHLHFIAGISNFDSKKQSSVVDNILFRKIVHQHFQERVLDPSFCNSLVDSETGKVTYRVRGDSEAILNRARAETLPSIDREMIRSNQVCI